MLSRSSLTRALVTGSPDGILFSWAWLSLVVFCLVSARAQSCPRPPPSPSPPAPTRPEPRPVPQAPRRKSPVQVPTFHLLRCVLPAFSVTYVWVQQCSRLLQLAERPVQ